MDEFGGTDGPFRRLQLDRRRFLSAAGAVGATVAVGGVAAACGQQRKLIHNGSAPSAPTPVASASVDESSLRKLLSGYQWPKTNVPEPKEPVTITIASDWIPSDLARQKVFDDYFTERHPNIKVTREDTPFADFLEKYLTAMAGGSLPDILVCYFGWAEQFIQSNVYAPLDNYISQSPEFDRADINDVSISYYIENGKTYGIPFDCGPIMLFYNKDIFDAAHMKYPTSDWTMEDLAQAAVKLTKGSGVDQQWGIDLTPAPSAYWDPVNLAPFGGQYLTNDESRCLLTEPSSVKATQWWYDLCVTKKAAPTPAESLATKADPFTLGRAAMAIQGSWSSPSLSQDAKFNWDITDMPKGPVTRITAAVGSGFGITQLSKNKDAAWIYMNEYLSAPGIEYMWALTGHGSPPRGKAWQAYIDSDFAPAHASLFRDAMTTYATSKGVEIKPSTPKVQNAVQPIWDRVVSGKISVTEGCATIAKTIDPILQQGD